MQNYLPLLFSILILIPCLNIPGRFTISLRQQISNVGKTSVSKPLQGSCPLKLNRIPLKLSGIKGFPTLTFSPNSRYIAIADDSGGSGVIIWDLLTQGNRNILPSAWGGQLRFSPDGKHLAIGFRNGDVLLTSFIDQTSVRLIGHKRGINAISFSPDGQHIATTSADNTARVWDLHGRSLAILPGIPRAKFGYAWERSPSVYGATWSAKGQLLFIASGKYVQIWQLPNKKPTILRNGKEEISDAVFSPNGKMVAVASGGVGKVWDLAGHQLITIATAGRSVQRINFSYDDRKILTILDDKTARLWDLKGKALAVFKGHENNVVKAAFSPDDNCVFTSSIDNTIRIWDVSGREIARLPGSFVMELSPDGQYLATAESDTVLVWKLR